MKWKIIITVFCSLLSGCASNTTNKSSEVSLSDIEKYNETTRVILTMSYFVGHTARKCQNLLKENNAFRKNIVKRWNQNNATHVNLAKNWTIDYTSDVSFGGGPEKRIRYIGEIMSDANESGGIASTNLLSLGEKENLNICREFRSLVEAGKYDLENMNLYPQVVKLAALIK